jgi:hypothetical protein
MKEVGNTEEVHHLPRQFVDREIRLDMLNAWGMVPPAGYWRCEWPAFPILRVALVKSV